MKVKEKKNYFYYLRISGWKNLKLHSYPKVKNYLNSYDLFTSKKLDFWLNEFHKIGIYIPFRGATRRPL